VSDDGGDDGGSSSDGQFGAFDEDEASPLARAIAWVVLTPIALFVGGALCAGALAVHYYNEFSDAQRLAGLAAGSELVREVRADVVDSANDGKLVYLTGPVVLRGTVADPDLGVAVEGVQLMRTVQMYQWEEKVTKRVTRTEGGGTTKTLEYDYTPRWSQHWLDSSTFKGPQPKRNPPSMRLQNASWQAEEVTVGAFRLDESQVTRVGTRENVDVSAMTNAPKVRDEPLKIANGEFYLGRDPAAPEVGDMRVSYSMWRPGMVSILARQSGNSFKPFDGWRELTADEQSSLSRRVADLLGKRAVFGARFTEIDEVRDGIVSKGDMFSRASRNSMLLTWGLRALATMVLIVGLQLIVWPFRILLSAIPPLRRMFEHARGYLSVRAGLGLSVMVCAYVQLTTRSLLDPAAARLLPQIMAVGLVAFIIHGMFRGRTAEAFGFPEREG